MGFVGPGEAAPIASAANEEIEIAAAGEREGVREWLVEILVQHVAAYHHAARAVDDVDGTRGVAPQIVEAAFGEPIIGVFEHREYRSAHDVRLMANSGRDHLGEP